MLTQRALPPTFSARRRAAPLYFAASRILPHKPSRGAPCAPRPPPATKKLLLSVSPLAAHPARRARPNLINRRIIH